MASPSGACLAADLRGLVRGWGGMFVSSLAASQVRRSISSGLSSSVSVYSNFPTLYSVQTNVGFAYLFDSTAARSRAPRLNFYSRIMQEVKERLITVEEITNGKILPLNWITVEFAALQIRLSIDCVALACLAVHGEIDETQRPKLQKLWSAGLILTELEELHESFFLNQSISR